jgi:hypothetical protein
MKNNEKHWLCYELHDSTYRIMFNFWVPVGKNVSKPVYFIILIKDI